MRKTVPTGAIARASSTTLRSSTSTVKTLSAPGTGMLSTTCASDILKSVSGWGRSAEIGNSGSSSPLSFGIAYVVRCSKSYTHETPSGEACSCHITGSRALQSLDVPSENPSTATRRAKSTTTCPCTRSQSAQRILRGACSEPASHHALLYQPLHSRPRRWLSEIRHSARIKAWEPNGRE